jgi:hypothetical protein
MWLLVEIGDWEQNPTRSLDEGEKIEEGIYEAPLRCRDGVGNVKTRGVIAVC